MEKLSGIPITCKVATKPWVTTTGNAIQVMLCLECAAKSCDYPTCYRLAFAHQHYLDITTIPPAQHRAISKLARMTNHVDRFNCTLRQRVSRLVRSTLSFSKNLANHIGAIKYFICDYNLTKSAALPG